MRRKRFSYESKCSRSSGLVGNELIHIILNAPEYERVYAVVRRSLEVDHPKLVEVICDFDKLEEVQEYFQVDDVFCCLGTTIKKAKTKEAMYKVDVEYPLTIAALAQKKGTSHFLILRFTGVYFVWKGSSLLDAQPIQIIFGPIYTVTIFVVGWFLWKKGIIRFQVGTYLGYSQFHNHRSCRAKYKLFNGFKYFYFRFHKETIVILKYSVKVDKGTITINLRNKAGELFTKTFTEDAEGEYEFITESKWHSVQFVGHKTRGSYSAEFSVVK